MKSKRGLFTGKLILKPGAKTVTTVEERRWNPQPSTRYEKTAGQLRGLGVAIRNDDFELIDDYRGQLRKIRRDYPELSRRQQQLTAFEGVLMNRLDEARALLGKPLLESVAWDSGL
jgi:hypothetical protein